MSHLIQPDTPRLRLRQWRADDQDAFAVLDNRRSRAVMERIGMTDTGRTFDHPRLPEASPLRRHCLYSLARAD